MPDHFKRQALRAIPLFAALSPEELNALATIAVAKTYAAGEVLFLEGQACEGLFVIARGRVKIVKSTSSGRQVVLAVEPAPSTVAEIPIFDGDPYPAGVIALEETIALLVLRRELHSICLRHPEISLKMLATVGRRLRTLVGLVESITFGSVRQRLAQLLLEQAAQAAAPDFALPGTHEELAFRLGTVREVVSRNLSRFQAEGLLRIERRQARLLDREGLEREAASEA